MDNLSYYSVWFATKISDTDYGKCMGNSVTFDEVSFGHLPASLVKEHSDFEFTWGEVNFVQRVWERETGQGHRVQMQVALMGAEQLSDIDSLIAFLAEYHEKQLEGWELKEFTHPDGPGRSGDQRVFWLARPGLAIQVRDPFSEIGEGELAQVANGVRLGWQKLSRLQYDGFMLSPRMATEADVPEIIRLRRIMLQDVDDLRTIDDTWENPTAEILKRWFNQIPPSTAVTVIDHPDQLGRLASFAIGTVDERIPMHYGGSPNVGYIYSVGTDRDQRGRGYGTVVVQALLDWFSHQDVRWVSLHGTHQGTEIYRKLGFKDNPWPELRYRY